MLQKKSGKNSKLKKGNKKQATKNQKKMQKKKGKFWYSHKHMHRVSKVYVS